MNYLLRLLLPVYSLDPVTLGIGAAALLGGGLAGAAISSAGSADTPAPAPPPAAPSRAPTGTPSTNKQMAAPSFLAAAAAPQSQNTGGKTLLGG